MQKTLSSNASKKNPVMKLAVTLLALAAPLAFAASCTSGSDDPAPENMESVEQGISCSCINGLGNPTTVDCPADNSCGEWYCTGIKACASACGFKKVLGEGDKCETGSGNTGACIQNDAGNGLFCCGCFDKEAGRCYDGSSPNRCGAYGEACQVCENQLCNAPTCSEGKCGLDPEPFEGVACDDNNACTPGSKCASGTCKGSGSVDCSDGDPCTTDPCNPATGCTAHQPVPNSPAVACNDGNVCTGPGNTDKCVNGECDGAPLNCNDGNPCTTDGCNSGTGCTHVSLAEGTTGCSDGNDCTTGDSCRDHDGDAGTPRICKGDGVTCFEDNPCVSHQCVGNDCPVNPTPVDGGSCDATACKTGETCQGGTCTGGEDVVCDDGNPCTVDGCNDITGCFYLPISNGATVGCDDGNPCTEEDKCNGDVCEGSPVVCQPLDSCHGPGTCGGTDGTCSDPRLPDDTVCETTGTCQNGSCEGGTVPNGTDGGAGGETGGGGEDGTGTSGSPGQGTGGASASGGETASDGGTASGGNAGEGSGATSSGGSAGTETDPNKEGGIYARDPGGCSCTVPGAPSERRTHGTLALLLIAGAAFLRRKRAA